MRARRTSHTPIRTVLAGTRASVALLHLVLLVACGASSHAPDASVASQPGATGATRADRAFERGVQALERGDGATAHAAFDEVLAAEPERADARLNRALASLLLGRASDAARDADLALEIDPDDPRTLRLAGGIYLRAGVRGRARSVLERAVEALPAGHPERADLSVELAILLADAGDLDTAADLLRDTLRRSRTPHALTNLARIQSARQNESEAAALYEEALDLSPFDPALLRAAADSIARRGNPARAADLLQRLMQILPATHAERAAIESEIRNLRTRTSSP